MATNWTHANETRKEEKKEETVEKPMMMWWLSRSLCLQQHDILMMRKDKWKYHDKNRPKTWHKKKKFSLDYSPPPHSLHGYERMSCILYATGWYYHVLTGCRRHSHQDCSGVIHACRLLNYVTKTMTTTSVCLPQPPLTNCLSHTRRNCFEFFFLYNLFLHYFTIGRQQISRLQK